MFMDRKPHHSKEVNSLQTDTITIKIPEGFLVNIDKILKCIWESTETRLAKTILDKKE